MSRQQQQMKEFQGITSCDAQKAESFLEHASWNLEVALSRFFDNPNNPTGQHHVPTPKPSPGRQQGGYNQGGYQQQGGYHQGGYQGGYQQGGFGNSGGFGNAWAGQQGGFGNSWAGQQMSFGGMGGGYGLSPQQMAHLAELQKPAEKPPKPSGFNKVSVLICEHVFPDGTKLQVRHGDMTEEDVGAIVNAANKHLDHGSGLAGAIRKKGGEMIQIESDIYIAENGSLKEGEVAVLGGHELKAQHVIHAVGPIWNGGLNSEPILLQMCVRNCLEAANTLKLSSVSLPAISTGIFRFPKPKCGELMFETIIDWVKEHPIDKRFLKEIRLTNFDDETVYIFKAELFKRFGGCDDSVEDKEKKPDSAPAGAPAGTPAGEQPVGTPPAPAGSVQQPLVSEDKMEAESTSSVQDKMEAESTSSVQDKMEAESISSVQVVDAPAVDAPVPAVEKPEEKMDTSQPTQDSQPAEITPTQTQ